MKINKEFITKASLALGSFAMMTSSALAATTYDYMYDLDDAAAGSAFLGLTGVWFVVVCCAALIGLLFLVLTIWMLVDVIKRTDAELPNRQTYMILLIVGLLFGFGWIVALVYFFGPRKKLAKPKAK